MVEKRSSRRFSELIRQIEESPGFKVEGLKVEIAEQIYLAMERNEISNSELARRMGKSRAYITKILRGNVNFTLETLVAISNALQMDIKIELTAKPAEFSWEISKSPFIHPIKPYPWQDREYINPVPATVNNQELEKVRNHEPIPTAA